MSHSPDFIPALIVFGLDDAGKAHASVFGANDVEAARTAAALMGMRDLAVAPGELADIVSQLPPGRVFDSGKAFVPFVKAGLHDRIAALAGPASEREAVSVGADGPAGPETAPAGSPEAAAGTASASARAAQTAAPDPWAQIGEGSVVLASEGKDEPYYEARVISEKAKGIFTVYFIGYPESDKIDRQAKQLALLHPSVAAKFKP